MKPHLVENVGVGVVLSTGFFYGSLHTAVQCIFCSKAVFSFFVAQDIAMLGKDCCEL